MPKFILELEEGFETLLLSDDGKYHASQTSYEDAICEALENYGFDLVEVKRIQEDT